MIEVNNISKKYGDHYAVKDLSFSIEKGKVYGFLGPNGAGKTTTMNIITGYLAPSSGTVTVDGHDVLKEAEEAKKCIGYLPEIPPLYPDMTVYEYLSFVAELKKVPRNERREEIEEIMEKVMISNMRDRMIKNLSKGYKQRVGLAQAIMGYPDVIILDEPTVGLDPKQILEIRELINDLKKNHTIILSSHILSEVSAICDHIMIISQGKMVASDTVENLNQSLSGEMHISLTLKTYESKLSEVLDTLNDISSYSISANPSDNSLIDAQIIISKDNDIRDTLSLALGEAGIPIYRLIADNKTLEEIFLELTETVSEENTENDSGENSTDNEPGADNTDYYSGENNIDDTAREVANHDSNL